MRPPLRILHLVQRYYPFAGGSELYFQELSERLACAGHHVEVWTTDAWDLDYFWSRTARRIPVEREVHNQVTVRRFPVRQFGTSRTYHLWRRAMVELSDLPVNATALLRRMSIVTPWVPMLRHALNALPTGSVDLVHSTNIGFESIVAAATRFATKHHIAHVITPFTHTGEPGIRYLSRYYTMRHQLDLHRRATRVIVQTDHERRFLSALGVPDEKMNVIGVGVNPEAATGGDGRRFRAKYGVQGPIVYCIGAAAFDKGTLDTIEAVRLLWKRGINVTLVMAGSTMVQPFRKAYESLPEEVRERCRWLGYISEDDKRDLAAAGSVFCMPSRTESFGIVYLEAWMNGVPVIGARAGGIPEVITNDVNGFLVDFHDVRALAERIARLLADSDLARRLGDAGRTHVLKSHTWDQKIKRIMSIYEELTAGRIAAPAIGAA